MPTFEEEIKTPGFTLINSFIKEHGLAYHHFITYEHFIHTVIPDTIINNPPFSLIVGKNKFSFRYKDVFMHTPTVVEANGSKTDIYPNNARTRSISYSGPFFITVEKTINNKTTEESFLGGYIPIMLQSSKCNLYNKSKDEYLKHEEDPSDPGGYFIINGTERVLVAQERMTYNRIFVFPPKNHEDDHYAEIKSMEESERKKEDKCYIVLSRINVLGKKALRFYCKSFKKEFPFGIILKAFGLSDFEIQSGLSDSSFDSLSDINKKDFHNIIESVIEDSYHISNQDSALLKLAHLGNNISLTEEKLNIFSNTALEKEVLPHLGITKESFRLKAEYLLIAAKKLLGCYFKIREYDDRDHFGVKRHDFSGQLLTQLFVQSFQKVNKELQQLVIKKLSGTQFPKDITVGQMFGHFIITKDISSAMSTGNWIISGNKGEPRTGVSQVLNRFNPIAMYSHLRRIIHTLPKRSATQKPRMSHNSNWNRVCPLDTPEGQHCGLTKSLSLISTVTISYPDIKIIQILKDYGVKQKQISNDDIIFEDDTEITIFVNQKPIGIIDRGLNLATKIRNLRRKGFLPYHLAIVEDDNEIHFNTDGGRLVCPLFIVRDNKLVITDDQLEMVRKGEMNWTDLLDAGVIEYLDAEEIETVLLCDYPENLKKTGLNYTHCEIDPSAMLGSTAQMIPYLHHNPCTRACYQTNMAKQAMGSLPLNKEFRMDTMSHELLYTQVPIISTTTAKIMGFDDSPAGCNLIVAVIPYGGWDTEDGVILNGSAIDRGLFNSNYYYTFKDSENRDSGNEEYFGKPAVDKKTQKILENGVVKPGTRVKDGDGIICVMSTNPEIKPRITFVKKGDEGIVHKVKFTTNLDGTRSVKVMIRQYRSPRVGDKVATRIAQKGVCCKIMRQEDMPFNAEGITPDICVTPIGFVGRMTNGQLLETHAGKAMLLQGKLGVATPFRDKDFDMACNILQTSGYQKQGWERLYDGPTGKMMEGLIFMGPCYFQRLKHMVADKIHARSRGPIQPLMRQPVEGRSRNGGLRIGLQKVSLKVEKRYN